MIVRQFLHSANSPDSPVHGSTSTALIAALALIDPRNLTIGRRLAYRGAVAALSGWIMWVSLKEAADTTISPGSRFALSAAAAGAALGFAEFGEALDARIHNHLARSGARRPRLWMAVGEAAFSLLTWWVSAKAERISQRRHAELEDDAEVLHDVPEEVAALLTRMLSATELYGAPQLRTQLAAAEIASYYDTTEPPFWPGTTGFTIPECLPRAVPGNATFPIIGRFRALDDRTFDLTLFVENGQIFGFHASEGSDWSAEQRDEWYEGGRSLDELTSWPSPDEVELLIETGTGYQVVQ